MAGIEDPQNEVSVSTKSLLDVPPASATYEEWLEQRVGHVRTNEVRRVHSADVVERGCEAV